MKHENPSALTGEEISPVDEPLSRGQAFHILFVGDGPGDGEGNMVRCVVGRDKNGSRGGSGPSV